MLVADRASGGERHVVKVCTWRAANNVDLVFLPTYAS
jgi:hypothetical protein